MGLRSAVRVASLGLVGLLVIAVSAPVAANEAPPNDDFDDATAITTLPFSDEVDTREATQAADDPDCFGAGPTVWYAVTLAEDTFVEVNTFGSDYDTTLSAYVGERGDLEQIACNDDAAGTLQSRIRFVAPAGETTFVMVGAFASGPGGDLVLNALETEPFTPLDIHLEVDPIGRVQPRTGTAWLTGTVTCSAPAFVDLSAELSQRAGRVIIRGSGFDFFECDGETPFELEIPGETGLFTGGRAHASVDAFGCQDLFFNDEPEPFNDGFDDNFDECDFDFVDQDVRLRGGPPR
jgi:hypothetical protein